MVFDTARLNLAQSFNLPQPTLTEKNLPDQGGRVFIVTGGYAGIGLELTKILYRANGIVYVAGRTEAKALEAIKAVKKDIPDSQGRIVFLQVDFADLKNVKPAVTRFLASETRLDVLTCNAGVMATPSDWETAQGHEFQLGVNNLGQYLFAKLLIPRLLETAKTSPRGSVRLTLAASLAVDQLAPEEGINWDGEKPVSTDVSDPNANYAVTKVGNVLLAHELAKQYPTISVLSWNPGNLKSDLARYASTPQQLALKLIMHETIFGAYTELWAGWSEEAGRSENSGRFVWPWGRWAEEIRPGMQRALKSESQGGNGNSAKFTLWCETQIASFM